MKPKPIGRICTACNSPNTYINKKNIPVWLKHDNHWYCKKCFNLYISNPFWNPINALIFNPRKMLFKDKSIYIEERRLKGICELCNKKIGDNYINKKGKVAVIKGTDIHHIDYHDNEPLEDTMELCDSCHAKESEIQKRLNKKYH